MYSTERRAPGEEAYTATNVRPPIAAGYGRTGASLSLRTFRDTYGSGAGELKRLRKNDRKLAAYSGQMIHRLRTINTVCASSKTPDG